MATKDNRDTSVTQYPNVLDKMPLLRREIYQPPNSQNDHFVGCIVGPEGSVKSYSALRIAEIVDPTFTGETVPDRVYFNPADFLEYIQEHRNELAPGTAFVLDEAGAGIGNRSWYEDGQIKLNQTLQTIRDDNFIILFTLPAEHEMDTQTSNRLRALMEMVTKRQDEWAQMRYYKRELKRKGRNKKIYDKSPRFRHDGQLYKARTITLAPPSNDISDAYEPMKDEWKDEQYQETVEALRGRSDNEDGEDGQSKLESIVDEIIESERVAEFVETNQSNGQKYIDDGLIKLEYPDLTQDEKRAVKSALQRESDEL